VKRCNLLKRAYPTSEYELRVIAPQVSEIAQVISFSPHISVRDAFQQILQTERFRRLASSTTEQFRLFLPARDNGIWMNFNLYLWHYDLCSGVCDVPTNNNSNNNLNNNSNNNSNNNLNNSNYNNNSNNTTCYDGCRCD
jgi:hypothetical protein